MPRRCHKGRVRGQQAYGWMDVLFFKQKAGYTNFFFCFEGRGIRKHVWRVPTCLWCSVVKPGWRCRRGRSRAPRGGCKLVESRADKRYPSFSLQNLHVRGEESTGIQNMCSARVGRVCVLSYGIKQKGGLPGQQGFPAEEGAFILCARGLFLGHPESGQLNSFRNGLLTFGQLSKRPSSRHDFQPVS